jgi:hypothetical protein
VVLVINFIIITFISNYSSDEYKNIFYNYTTSGLAFYRYYLIVLVIKFTTVKCTSKFWSRWIYTYTIIKQN